MIENIEILKEKFSDKELKKLDKFYPTLSLISSIELTSLLSYLEKNGIVISKANELKVLTNSEDELKYKLSLLSSVGEEDLVKQDPKKLNYNLLDIIKRINYCKQKGIDYKDEKGKYKAFLSSTAKWSEIASNEVVKETEKEVEKTEEDYSFDKIKAELEETRKSLEDEFSFITFDELEEGRSK